MQYRKKIFDIIPPKEKKIKNLSFLGKEELSEVKLLPKPSLYFKRSLVIFLIILITGFTACYFLIKTQAVVEIWPKTEAKEFKTLLQASTLTSQPDFSQKLIPAAPLEGEKTISQEFSSSITTTEEKAHGIIRVYNKYYLPVTLIKDTRFFSSDSDVEFISQRKITIQAGGFIDVEVIAAAPGEEHNINPCAFSIPNLRKFSPPQLYYDITGKSFSPMTGGRIAKVPRVTEEDLSRAEKELRERALREGKDALKESSSKDVIILEETINQEIVESSPLAKVGQEIERFTFQIKAKTKAFGIKKLDLENFGRDYLVSKILPDKEVYTESLNINYSSKEVNLKEGKTTLSLTISAEIYSKIDEGLLKKIVKGRDSGEIQKDVLTNFPEISKVQLKISPFWQRKTPQNLENIRIKINF